jgi:hypothetical protein
MTIMKTKLTLIISASAVTLLALVIPNTALAQGESRAGGYQQTTKSTSGGMTPGNMTRDTKRAGSVAKATQVTKDEAAKKYPPPKGGYPTGERDPHKPSGIVNSPYPPLTEFDCSEVPKGGLVLDSHVNKVFIRP